MGGGGGLRALRVVSINGHVGDVLWRAISEKKKLIQIFKVSFNAGLRDSRNYGRKQ